MAHVSLFIGSVRPLHGSGRPSAIVKQAVVTPLDLLTEGFTGDQQADRRVHGGPDKAVHLYPAGHYRKLSQAFPELSRQFVAGSLGENLSTDALDESTVSIGDIYQLGTAQLQVCQPRNPCWKIDTRFATEGIAAYIAEHGLTGWYWRVLSPGRVTPGDTLRCLASSGAPSLAAAMQLWQSHRPTPDALEELAATPGIAEDWQRKIQTRADWLRRNTPPAFHVKLETP
jgi:MOSC domain-containing protein YiiM